jgi:restriction system protein
MEFGSRLKPRVALALAALSYVVMHMVYVETLPVLSSVSQSIGGVAQRSLTHLIAAALQYIIPFCLMVGTLVYVLRRHRAQGHLKDAQEGGSQAMAAMSWEAFERLVGAIFHERRYFVIENGARGPDGGVDLWLSRHGKRYLVQCKHWKRAQVGVAVVRELVGVISVEGAAGGFVVTGGTFTGEARGFARRANIELIDGDTLSAFIGARHGTWPKPQGERDELEKPTCPKCGATMVQRRSTQGKFAGQPFWGCARYPQCNAIISIG